jgi:hypothetical protein
MREEVVEVECARVMDVRRHDRKVTYVEPCNELGEDESYIGKNE